MKLILKTAPSPQRLRRIPKQFSWLDQRLVRDGYLQRCCHSDAALYLFLSVVADSHGLSYYSDSSVQRIVSMSHKQLEQSRQNLCSLDLLAYRAPLYQLLDLDWMPSLSQSTTATEEEPHNQTPLSMTQPLRRIAGGVS